VIFLPNHKTEQTTFPLKKPLHTHDIDYLIKQQIERYLPKFTEHDYYDYTLQHTKQEAITVTVVTAQGLHPLINTLQKCRLTLLAIRTQLEMPPLPPDIPAPFLTAYAAGLSGLSM
jgi:hypothetical protein